MITVCTARLNYGGKGLNITVKSADPAGAILAPTWDLVMGFRRHRLSSEEYTAGYYSLLRNRWRENPAPFLELLTKSKHLTLLCYCPPHTFCHRYLAVDILEKIAESRGIAFRRGGETLDLYIR